MVKPGDIRIGIGDGETGGVIFLVLEVPLAPYYGRAVKLLRGNKLVRENLYWIETKTRPLESFIEAR